jgi:hypothetical protein
MPSHFAQVLLVALILLVVGYCLWSKNRMHKLFNSPEDEGYNVSL